MKKILIFALLIIIGITSCRKDNTFTDDIIDPPNVDNKFIQNVYGQVEDLDGKTIEGVTVSMSEENFTTDENGFFLFKDVAVGNKGVHISAEHEDYFFGGYRLYANSNTNNFVKIILTPKEKIGEFDSTQGSKIPISQNGTIDFPINGISLNGSPYSGIVNVYGTWIDPTSENMLELMPGDLIGTNSNNIDVILKSFGMMGVELETPTGDELQVTEGVEVELRFGIPDEILAFAPETIPLWHFNESSGKWIEEGLANLEDKQYVGKVGHFSWWNSDLPDSRIEACFEITDSDGEDNVAGLKIQVLSITGYGQAYGYTNEDGVLCGLVPADEILLLNVYDNCGQLVHTEEIGPFTSSPVNIPLVLDLELPFEIDISGTVTDCNEGIVDAGYMVFEYEGERSITLTNDDGTYSHSLNTCQSVSSLIINGIDLTTQFTGQATLTDLDEGEYTQDMVLCDSFDEIFTMTGDAPQLPVLIFSCKARQEANETLILADNNSGNKELLGIQGFSTGTFNAHFLGSAGTANGTEMTVEITEYGNVDGLIRGSISGMVDGVFVEGNFVATREK